VVEVGVTIAVALFMVNVPAEYVKVGVVEQPECVAADGVIV
jgi:hypothetical protein